ncbi:serine O-acetyltransferase [Oceanicola sp. 502str15]|uniref:serine O-acetyltransferase n=1 Tax=Oceanicola sp. 502str15 TaxID=2696061 RepID=UPI002094AA19|nr:serine acetyltransferase [Oceanicola sp. 502str15]MCO6381956.1 serine acetyltransferase [Oceanicola sp. 502str15]
MSRAPRPPSTLRRDLLANTGRHSLAALPLAWLQSPGFAALTCWRMARRLQRHGPPGRLLAALLWRYGVARHGCFISLHASIGPGLRLPHPVGVVVGEGARIGAGVTLYQNVTLGLRHEARPAYPTLDAGACLYAGAMVLGAVTVGAGARIGAASLVLEDVAPHATFTGRPAAPPPPLAPTAREARR